MARLYTEDFESGTSGWTTTNGSPTIVTTQFNTGTHSLRCNPTAAAASINKTCATISDTSTTSMFLRVYIRIATAPSATTTVLAWADSASAVTGFYGLRLRNDRTLLATSSTGTTGTASSALALNTWYRLEIEYNDGTNTLKGYLDGVNFSGTVTGAGLGGGAFARMGVMQAVTADLFFDDFAVNDSLTGSDNGLPGAVVTNTPISDSDTGSGAEGTPTIGISDTTESASGDGSHSIAATSSDSDAGSGVETSSIAAAVSGSDTASGLEDQTVGQPTTDSDSTSAGSESESLAVALSGTDTSSGADSEALTAALTDSDTGSGAEGTASIAFVDLETASGADVESILAAISGTDAVSGADTEDTVQGASDAESGGSSETFVLVAYVYESDGAEWTDTQISPDAQPPQIGDYPNTLVQGPAELFVATFPAVEPLDANVAFEPDSGVWTDLGSTLGGVELSIEQEFLSFELMQVPGTTFQRLKRRDMKVKMELAETTLANLAYALNESPTGQTFEPTQRSEADTLPYKALMIRGWAPGFTPEGRHLRRTVIIRKALSNDNVVTKFSKEDQTTYSITWACHYVDENTRPFRIVEEA